ncbi:MAG: AAA family ATPase [Clostridia bacterium]|nr:AAA family ATPase [Clostridia bacterium]
MFIGREEEIKLIGSELSKPSAFVIVYGTRRVGKTSLLKEAVKKSSDKTIYFECQALPLEFNLSLFLETLEDLGFDIDREKLTSFDRVFKYLNGFGESFNVIIDEYPYLKKSAGGNVMDSVFQSVVDNYLHGIRLFLSGSDVGMMKELCCYDNALFGRCTRIIELKEWDYKEASMCYPNLSPYDKVAFYSVFGGTPYLNTSIDAAKSIKENITELYLKENGAARIYASQLLMTGASDMKLFVEPILIVLGNGRRRYGEIKAATKISSDSVLKKYLDTAIKLGLIVKVYPVNRDGDAKKASYEIADNVLRFYYSFIFKHQSDLYDMGEDLFYEEYVRPHLTAYVSKRFEDICRTYFRRLIKSGKYKDARRVGRYYYDDSVTQKSGEFDVAVKKEPYRGMYCYDIYEVKYHEKPFSEKGMRLETEQILDINEIKVQNIGFVSVNGFEEGCEGILITGDDLYR